MKNIWKLLMIAMMAIAMVGCPNTGNNGEEGGESGSGSVYTATITADMIGTGWGSIEGETDTIKFVLAPKSVTVEDENCFTDANKMYVYSHNDIDNGHIYFDQIPANGWLQVSAKYDNTKYAGTAVKKNADGGYTVMIDLSKISTADLCSKGAAESAKGVDSWNSFSKIAKEYVPYLIGSVTANYYTEDNPEAPEFDIVFGSWNSAVIKMSSTSTAFPANVTKPTVGDAPERFIDWEKTYYLKGAMNGWSDHAENKLIDGTAVFEYTGEDDATCDFKVSTADWNDGFMNFQIAALNTDVEGNSTDNYRLGGEADKTNAQILPGILKNGTTYSLVFTIVDGNTTFKVKLIEGGELPIVPEDSSVVEPESSEIAAESSEAAAESSEAAAESSEAAAESSEAAAESSEAAAESSEAAAESSEVAAESSEVAADSSNA